MNTLWRQPGSGLAAFAQSAPKDAIGARQWLAGALALDAQATARAGMQDFRENAETRETFMNAVAEFGNAELLRALAELPERDWHLPGRYFPMPGERERRHETALHAAIYLDRWEAAAALGEHIDFGALNGLAKDGFSGGLGAVAVVLGVSARNPALRDPIARLLARIADTANITSQEWEEIAGRAAELDSVELLERAATAGVDLRASFAVNITTYDRVTKRPLLCVAAAAAATRVAKWLIGRGQAPDECADAMGNTPLMWATNARGLYHADEESLMECVKTLAEASRIDAQGNGGKTALAWAAISAGHGNGAKALFFLLGRANPNLKDDEGDTALMTAISASIDQDGNAAPEILPVVEALAAASDLRLTNENGQTALDMAVSAALASDGNQDAKAWSVANALFAGMSPQQAGEAMMEIAKKILPRAVPKLEALALAEELDRTRQTEEKPAVSQENEPSEREEKESKAGANEASVGANASPSRAAGRSRL